ncbi:hypothetical protein Tco_1185730 [Tanacetum coccineum]
MTTPRPTHFPATTPRAGVFASFVIISDSNNEITTLPVIHAPPSQDRTPSLYGYPLDSGNDSLDEDLSKTTESLHTQTASTSVAYPPPTRPLPTSPAFACRQGKEILMPLGYRAAMVRWRAAPPSTCHPLFLSEIPSSSSPPSLLPSSSSPPLSLLPSSSHKRSRSPSPLLPPPTRRDIIPEADMPPRKRARVAAPSCRFEIGESSTATAARQPGSALAQGTEYGFVTALEEVNERVTDLATSHRLDSHKMHIESMDLQQHRRNDVDRVIRLSGLVRDQRYARELERQDGLPDACSSC